MWQAPKAVVPTLKLEELEVGQELAGVIRTNTTFGSFVSCGAECDGLIHVSNLSKEYIESIEDVVQPGASCARCMWRVIHAALFAACVSSSVGS